jgi:RimJ/RimL family protein N-acetyltransferase
MPPTQVYLETERLLLRRLTPADGDRLAELDADPQVTFHITGGPPEFTDAMLRHWLAEYERWPGLGVWAAVERASGQFLGWFHLRPEDGATDVLELGYRLKRSAWGNGYATEGSRALVAKAFRELGAARVVAYSMAVHAASRRVMEKAGLRYLRTFHADWPYRIPGDEQGDVAYAITREEWARDGA